MQAIYSAISSQYLVTFKNYNYRVFELNCTIFKANKQLNCDSDLQKTYKNNLADI